MYKYHIENVDCQNCAAKIEKYILSNTNATRVTINIISGKLIIEGEYIEPEHLTKLANKVEDDVLISTTAKEAQEKEEKDYSKILLTLGFVFFVIGLVTKIQVTYLIGYVIVGYPVIKLAIKNMLNKQFFDEYFLMTIATLAAIGINEWAEALAVMLFYSVGEYIQQKTLAKTKSSITALGKLNVKQANLVRDGKIYAVDVDELLPGDIISVSKGERIAVDSILETNVGYVNNAHITGESKELKITIGDEVYGGSINAGDEMRLCVKNVASESTIAKLIELITYADSQKTNTERFITRFSKVYTPIVVAIAAFIVFFFPSIFGITYEESIYRAVTLLVISCPCAFVLSVPLGYVVAIGHMAKEHILVKGSIAVDKMRNITVIAFDKTGTITSGNFAVSEFTNNSKYEDQYIFGLVKSAEQGIVHPVARSLYEYTSGSELLAISDVKVIEGSGISFNYNNNEYKLIKGEATQARTTSNLFENEQLIAKFMMEDAIKGEAFVLIEKLKKLNIKPIILTGDNEYVASQVAQKIKLSEKNVYNNLLPKDKLDIIEEYINTNETVAFVGDGLNDAAAIKRSDVGVSMGVRGSELAVDSSDVVISDDNVSKISDAIVISKYTHKIIKQNIILAFTVKVIFIILGIIGITTMWEAVFSDVGVTLIAIANTMRIKKE